MNSPLNLANKNRFVFKELKLKVSERDSVTQPGMKKIVNVHKLALVMAKYPCVFPGYEAHSINPNSLLCS